MLGLRKRTVGYYDAVSVKIQLYVSLMRSRLEYCSSVWSGLTKTNVQRLDRVQRHATAHISNNPPVHYNERLRIFNILPLSYRRDIHDLFMYNCVSNQCEPTYTSRQKEMLVLELTIM